MEIKRKIDGETKNCGASERNKALEGDNTS